MDEFKYEIDDQICRICLSNTGQMNAIFDSSRNISNIIMSLANVQMNENDGLPEVICSNCVFEANNACLFKQKCEESDKFLRTKVQNNRPLVKEEMPISIPDDIPIPTTEDINELFNEECENSVIEMLKFEPKLLEDSVGSLKSDTPSEISDEKMDPSSTKISNDDEKMLTKKRRGRPRKNPTLLAEEKSNPIFKLQCSECDEAFEKKINLKRHMASDHVHIEGEKNFQCIECKKLYPSERFLIIHMKTHSSKIYDCDECDKKFPRLDILMEHKKRHTNERSYLCTQCGKGFYNQIYLDRHMQTHSKEKLMHQCTICGKIMAHSNHLMVHMRAHKDRTGPMITENENKKLILCSVCGKSCSSRSNLAVHMRRHTGEMTNFCTVCGKGYPRSTDLTIHMRQHTGEKPFCCIICARTFARSDKLAIHMRTHTGEKPYLCNVCGRSFAQSNDLASHKRRNICCAPSQSESTINILHMEIEPADIEQATTINVSGNQRLITTMRLANNRTMEETTNGAIDSRCNLQQQSSIPSVTFLPNFTTSSFR